MALVSLSSFVVCWVGGALEILAIDGPNGHMLLGKRMVYVTIWHRLGIGQSGGTTMNGH